MFADLCNGVSRVSICFDVERDQISAGISKRFDIFDGVGQHKMNVEKHSGIFTERFDQSRSECQVRNKVTVHDIEMEQLATGSFCFCDLFAQL